MVLREFIRWLDCGKASPKGQDPKTWITYYAPILPEDVAIGMAEFAIRFSLQKFYNQSINMISTITKHNIWDERWTWGQTVEMILRKHPPNLRIARLLILYWAMHHIVTSGEDHFVDMRLLAKNEELNKVWWQEHKRILKANGTDHAKCEIEDYVYPQLEYYYWE
jgi:hypothetical protein